MAKARISRFEAEPLDPATNLQHWDSIDFPDPTEYSSATQENSYYDPVAFDSYQSHQQQQQQSTAEDLSRTGYGRSFPSPISPPLQTQGWARMDSVVSPQSPDFARATSGPLGYSPVDAMGGPRLSTFRSSSPDIGTTGLPPRGNSPTYSIPPPPKTPSIPMDIDDTDYQHVKMSSHNAIDREGPYSDRGSWPGALGSGPGANMGRNVSLARRISKRIISTVKRPKSMFVQGRGEVIDEEAVPTRDGGYSKIEGEEPVAFPFDLGIFSPEHTPANAMQVIPPAAAQAMKAHQMDQGQLYVENGEVYDLSSFRGPDDKSEFKRAGNLLGGNDQKSYYFTPNRDIPNWKPFSMTNWFIIFLLLISLGLIGGAEALYQLSSRGKLRSDGKKGILEFQTVKELNVVQFAIWKYMPTLVAVIYGILWKITDTEVKRTEPYYQLSKGIGSGALAASTLNIEYQTFWSLLVPIEAIRHKQWVVVASSIASLLAFAVVPVFLSVFVEITPSQKVRQQMAEKDKDILKTITVESEFTRILEATLLVILIFGIYMLIQLNRRRSGLLGDPSGIAGVAAMANKSHILMDFQGLDMASEEKIHKQLNKRTYILHKGSLWQAHFLKESERDNQAPKAMNAHPLLLRLKGGIPFLAFLVVFTAFLPPMARDTVLNVVVDKTPWVLTLLAVTIKSLWEIVEKDMRMLEPFWLLYKRHAPSSVLTLDYSATIPGWLPIKALFKGHFLLAWVGFVSVLVEILTVVLGSLDYQGGEESDTSYNVSFALAMVILGILIQTMCLVLYLRHRAFLPRQPGTISSVLAFIHQSNMLVDFEGTEQATTAERRIKLARIGKKYGFGWFKGRDGRKHLGIDAEELTGSYKFGDDSQLRGTISNLTWETFES